MKKLISLALALVMVLSLVATGFAADEKQSITVAALQTAYGAEIWTNIAEAFEAQTGVHVNLIVDKNLEDVITASMKAGDFPDVCHLALSRKAALPETMIKEHLLTDLTEVFEMTVPGEDVKVKDKLAPGFIDSSVTNPYGDGKTYLAPMFYSPCGLFYNANLLKEKGWEVPTTFDEMWELGEKAKQEGIALFAYPHAGYFDAFTFALMYEIGGADFFNKITHYEEGIYETEEAKTLFDILGKLATYTEKTVPSNGNNDNFQKNQQLILDNKAIFMPNGTWVVNEMKDAPRAEGFEWGFTALPAVKEGGDRYSYTFFEQIWLPSEAKNPEAAKQFLAFLYSDKAAEIFAKADAIQPIKGMSDKLEGYSKLFYSVYDNGAKAALGNFAPTEPVEGVNIMDTYFYTFDSIVTGEKTVDTWMEQIVKDTDQLRNALR